MPTFQEILRQLSHFWEKQGCIIHQGYDLETGAGTFNPATFLRCLGPEPYKAGYVEPSRRPTDGRYGTNPNRLQHYFQYQVILKPSPPDIQDLYLRSLEAIGFDLKKHDIRFVHDDWEAPTQGAWGLGWEVWMDGMEITQFTYFQCMGGVLLKPITGEITYGIERLAMYLQNVDSIFDLRWNDGLTYGDIYHRNEVEWSRYNFEEASTEMWFRHFQDYESEAKRLISLGLPIPAYDFIIKASHAFNLLDARGVISVSERTGYIARIRELAHLIAESYIKSREEQNFPLLVSSPQEKNPKLQPKAQATAKLETDKREDFLLEIGSEELPDTFIPLGCANLEKELRKLLEKEEIPFKDISCYGTPRRLTAYVEDLALARPPQIKERRGPSLTHAFDSEGTLTAAAEGFFRSLDKPFLSLKEIRAGKDADIRIKTIKGTEYLIASVKTPGKATDDILSQTLPKLIQSIDFPKKMRWGNLDITYARPLHWIVALHGKHIVPFTLGDIASGKESQGHRQLSPGLIPLSHPREYFSQLRHKHVMVDPQERKSAVLAQLNEIEIETKGHIVARDEVLPAVVNMVEWPMLTVATFDSVFMKAPKEVLISEMVHHQRYFPVANADGSLKNLFVITADTTPTDKIRQGNQKVLSARLSDGVFLYEQDLKTPLDVFNNKLQNVTFLQELGSLHEKVERIVKHVEVLHKHLPTANLANTKRAALLCKADLTSEMVYEFPELQGMIGKHYALKQGEKQEVAQAIEEHWMPRKENAPLPETHAGILLSLADKIDNLLSCFLLGLKPSSSSDPYALRRQVLGIIKMLIQSESHLPLMDVFKKCFAHFPKKWQTKKQETLEAIENFFINRIKTVFQDYGLRKDEIEASVANGFTDIYETFRKVKALHHFRRSRNQFPLLFEVYKRARGQLNNYQPKAFSHKLLKEKAEKDLDSLLSSLQQSFDQAIAQHEYDKAYEMIATIQPALANLFDEVKILADDPKLQENRLALLKRVFGFFSKLLDFSKIQE